MLKKIVLIEDNPADVILARYAIQRLRPAPDLIHFSSGPDLLSFLDKGDIPEIGLILMDLNLPRMNGREILELIRNRPELAELPVVIFSCSSDMRDIHSCYQSGADAYVQKPLELEEFDRTIESMINFWYHSHSAVYQY